MEDLYYSFGAKAVTDLGTYGEDYWLGAEANQLQRCKQNKSNSPERKKNHARKKRTRTV